MKTGHKILFGLGLCAAAVGTGVVVHRVVTRRPLALRVKNPHKAMAAHAQGALVSPAILSRLHPRIDQDAIADHVVHLTPAAQNAVYDAAKALWAGTDVPQSKDAVVRTVLERAIPGRSWQVSRTALADEDPVAQIWDGAAWLVELMGASAEDEAREAQTVVAGAAS